MSLKDLLTTSYGAGIHELTTKYKKEATNSAKIKNQWVFLQRCAHHHVIPTSLQTRSPVNGKEAKKLNDKYR